MNTKGTIKKIGGAVVLDLALLAINLLITIPISKKIADKQMKEFYSMEEES